MPFESKMSANSERARLSALYEYDILDSPPEHEYDNITKLASLICNTPIAAIVLVDEKRLWVKSVVGVSVAEIPRGFTLTEYALQEANVTVINDTLEDPRFKDHTTVASHPKIRFFAAAPLIDDKGYTLGVIAVYDTVPKKLKDEQVEGLQTLAKEIITHFTLKKKSQELVDNTQLFEELLNITAISPEIHCIVDPSGKIKSINNAVTSLLGYTIEEAIGMNIWNFCFRDDIFRVVTTVENFLKSHVKQFSIDFRVVNRTGAIKWFSWSLITKKQVWYCYGRDITENKRVENELMKLSFVASKVNNAVVINDANNHVTWVNDAFEQITGFTLDDLKGHRLGDLITGPETDLDRLALARELIKQNQSFTVDLLAYRKDKQPIWLSIYNTVVFDDEGKVDIEVEIIHDITEKKKAEQELQVLSLVASKTNTGVNIMDRDGNTTWVNESLEKLTGYSLAELEGKKLGNVFSTSESDFALIEQSRLKALDKKPYTIEVQARKKDGTPVWLAVSNTPIVNNNVVERQIDLITDITQRKEVEREILESKEQALQLSEAKEMFLSVMSHEIRTPLNAVIGMTHLLIDNDPKPSQINDLNVLKFSAENLLHIINDILDFTKIETGNLQLESRPINLNVLVTEIIKSLQTNASRRGNVLSLHYDTNIPLQILGDSTRLYQVLMNLLGNAIKFTENGAVDLVIKLVNQTEEGSNIYFEVKDNGIGIPEDKRAYIFETFTQAKADISRKYGGTGLGLAITKKLLRLYGSDIDLSSTEGKGSTFSFTLYFKAAEVVPEQPKLADTTALFKDRSILIVDDNEINIMIANRILSKWGLLIDFASNGYEAIEKIKSKAYDLIFMDIKMPGMDGFETTAMIRNLPQFYVKNVPIIALTASSLDNEHEKFDQSSMNGHILKPFNPEEIKQLLIKHLE